MHLHLMEFGRYILGRGISNPGIPGFGQGGQMEAVLVEVVGLVMSPFELKFTSFISSTSPWIS